MLFIQGAAFAGDMGGSPASGRTGFWGGSSNWPTGTYGMNNSIQVYGGTVYFQWCSNGYDDVVTGGYNVTRDSGNGSISWGSPSVNGDAGIYSVSGTVNGIGSYRGQLTASYYREDYGTNYWTQSGNISLAHAKPSKPTVTSLPNVYSSTTFVTLSANSTDNDGDAIRYHWYYSKNNGSWTDLGYTGYANSGTTANKTFSFTPVVNDFYKFYCYAECSNAQISNDSNQIGFTILNQNPNTPTSVSAPSSAYNNSSISLSATATDPEGHNVKFNWQYKKNNDSWSNIGSTSFVSSGSAGTLSWTPNPKPMPGDTLYFKCQAQDSNNGTSGWSSEVSTTIGNRNPGIPVIDTSMPQYTNSTAVSLVAKANDPDDQKVQIFWQYKKTSDATWTDINWTSQVNSDANVTYNFTLPTADGANYVFRCKAKDESGLESAVPTWAETNVTLIDVRINEFTDRVTGKNNWITTQTDNEKNNWYNIGAEVVEKVVIEDYLSVGFNKYDIEVDLDAPNPTNRNSQVQPNTKQVVAVYRIQGATKTQITIPAANIDTSDATKVRITLDTPSTGSKIEVYLKYKIIKTGQATTSLTTANKLLKNKVTVVGTKGTLTKSVNKDIDWILNVNEVELNYQ